MGLLDLKTDLKSITYSSVDSRGPYVSKPIPGNNQQGSTTTEISARRDDLSRLVKMLGDRPGLQFLANQTLLTQAETAREFKKAREEGKTVFGALLKSTGKSLLGTAKTTASILAQVPVNGTGTHFIIGLGGNQYLQSGQGAQTGLGRFFRSIGIGGGVNGAARALQGRPIILDYEGQGEFNFPVDDNLKGKDSKFGVDQGLFQGKGKLPYSQQEKDFKPEYRINGANYALDEKHIRLKLNTVKINTAGKNPNDRTITKAQDEVNVKGIADNTEEILKASPKDIIPFYFNIFTPKDTKGKLLYFRAFLNSLNDDYNGSWAGSKYIGRAEEFYTYQGFKRTIGFDFVVAAFSRNELIPLYQKLNALVGSTAPTYRGSGQFMQGTLASVTIGDYINNQEGFIESVRLNWDKSHQWEIDYESLNFPVLPHVLNVSIGFTPIHNFNVKYDLDTKQGQNYIGGDKDLTPQLRPNITPPTETQIQNFNRAVGATGPDLLGSGG